MFSNKFGKHIMQVSDTIQCRCSQKSLSFRWKTRTFAQLYSWTPLHVAWLLACQNLLARWGIHVCGEGDTIF
jgi:uncharacterized protein YqjF (DUF2071 family)